MARPGMSSADGRGGSAAGRGRQSGRTRRASRRRPTALVPGSRSVRAAAAELYRSALKPRAEGGVMDEKSFWVSLEFRLCGEFAGLPERRYQYFWCDGFIPRDYLLDDPRPRITGTAWICNGPAQNEWDFALLLPRAFGSREEIDWASLL